MPSTTTTNVTIGTILDLIGPTVQPAAPNDSQSAFDSLLQAIQPSPAPPPSEPSPPLADSRSSSAAHSRSRDRKQQPAASEPTVSDNSANGSSQDHDSAQPATAQATTPTAASNATGPGEHQDSDHTDDQRSDKPDDQIASQQVVAQSLAGLPTAAKNISPPVAPAATETAATTDETANSAPTKPLASPGKPSTTTQPNTAQSDVPVQGTSATPANAQQAVSDQLKPITTAAAGESKAQQATAKTQTVDQVQPANKDDKDQASTDDSQQTLDIKLTSDPQPQPAPPKPHDQPPGGDPLQHTPDISATGTPPSDSTNPQNANATPLVAPVVNLNPASQTTVASQSANSNATAAISNASPRPRLPAQSLAPAANAAARQGSVEVDSTRLISRVVRAFSAAQERDGEVHLRLSPPELGSLRLDVRVENGALTAHVQTETDAARTAIIDNLPALRDRLAEQGVRIDRFDVDLMQRQPGGMPDQPGGRQPDMPEAPLRFPPPTRSTVATAPITTSSSPLLGGSSGLNVVI